LEWKLARDEKGSRIDDPAAWLIKAIEEDYKPPQDFKTRAQREAEQAERDRRQLEQAKLAEDQAAQVEEQRRRESEQAEAKQKTALKLARQKHGTTAQEIGFWDQLKIAIKDNLTAAMYHMLIMPSHLLSVRDRVATIGVPNAMIRDRLEHQLADILKRAFRSAGAQIDELAFVLLDQPPDPPPINTATEQEISYSAASL
jgi:hypothetical protein